jgi:hypothetical protein
MPGGYAGETPGAARLDSARQSSASSRTAIDGA